MALTGLLPHILDLAVVEPSKLPNEARKMAQLSLMDWLSVSLAGANEPLARIVRDFVAADGGMPMATVTGSDFLLPVRSAALANGTISHALDYDDTHFAYIGHPSVAIYPAALAVAEEIGATADAAVDAFLVGAEAACRIGMVLGRDHYDAGFHQTATSGAFGSTVAACRLYQMDREQTSMALGLVSTLASGLKSQFGTMTKPFNAGAAAANGVDAARLARNGFTASDDAFAGPQSFMAAHHASFHAGSNVGDMIATWALDRFMFADVRHKLHACCHGTHAMIEALLRLKGGHKFDTGNIASIHVHTPQFWLNVCDVKTPRTGLEIKFSYVFLAAMLLEEKNLAAYETYNDAVCTDVVIKALASKVQVVGDETIADTASLVRIVFHDGRSIEDSFDLLAPLDLNLLTLRLKAKSTGLIGANKTDQIWAEITDGGDVYAADIARYLKG
ncbi:MmgE/PrpD family protein [Candidatus Puniceispirillum sp.]|nr:MmgE/PrpD family protein [Candidatus Puniceispirillum sp.]